MKYAQQEEELYILRRQVKTGRSPGQDRAVQAHIDWDPLADRVSVYSGTST